MLAVRVMLAGVRIVILVAVRLFTRGRRVVQFRLVRPHAAAVVRVQTLWRTRRRVLGRRPLVHLGLVKAGRVHRHVSIDVLRLASNRSTPAPRRMVRLSVHHVLSRVEAPCPRTVGNVEPWPWLRKIGARMSRLERWPRRGCVDRFVVRVQLLHLVAIRCPGAKSRAADISSRGPRLLDRRRV